VEVIQDAEWNSEPETWKKGAFESGSLEENIRFHHRKPKNPGRSTAIFDVLSIIGAEDPSAGKDSGRNPPFFFCIPPW